MKHCPMKVKTLLNVVAQFCPAAAAKSMHWCCVALVVSPQVDSFRLSIKSI